MILKNDLVYPGFPKLGVLNHKIQYYTFICKKTFRQKRSQFIYLAYYAIKKKNSILIQNNIWIFLTYFHFIIFQRKLVPYIKNKFTLKYNTIFF